MTPLGRNSSIEPRAHRHQLFLDDKANLSSSKDFAIAAGSMQVRVRALHVQQSTIEMFHKSVQKSQSPHAYDYGAAIAKAVEWLGDRYLLAKPINTGPWQQRPRRQAARVEPGPLGTRVAVVGGQ
jgi:hypothetical protein